jgi:transcriptional regulator with XRE-family HTH domain
MTGSFRRLQQARAQAGYENATDAAKMFGWNENTYRSHENGERGITRAADKYARAFGVTSGWLLTGEDVGSVSSDLGQLITEARINQLGRVPEWLSTALRQSDTSQAELARLLSAALGHSVDRAAINKMVTGKRAISAEEMIEISKITDHPLPTTLATEKLIAVVSKQHSETLRINESAKPGRNRGDDIRKARLAKGWSQDRLAAEVGISQPAIKKIEDGDTERSRFLSDIEAVLGLMPSATMTSLPVRGKAEVALSIFGTTQAMSGCLEISNGAIDATPMPEPLRNVHDAYGLYIAGNSMVPRYRPGDLLLIHPHLPARAEDGVVIRSPNNTLMQIGEFVRSTETEWVLRRYSEPQDIHLPKAEWPNCHFIYGSYSRR